MVEMRRHNFSGEAHKVIAASSPASKVGFITSLAKVGAQGDKRIPELGPDAIEVTEEVLAGGLVAAYEKVLAGKTA